MRILFIHEVSYLKKPVYEIHEFPERLAKLGHEISFFEFDEGKKFWDPSTSQSAGSIKGRLVDGVRIRLLRAFQLGIPGVDRILVVFSSILKLRKIISRNNFDVIVLYAVPTFGAQTIWFSRRAGIPVMFRALDVSHSIRKSIFTPMIKSIERYVYKNANLLSSNNIAMEIYCLELSGRGGNSVVHYPPLDLDHFKSVARDNKLRERLGIKLTDKVIVYMGSFFYFSGLVEALFEFAARSSSIAGLKLLLLGGGEQDKELRRLAEVLGISDKVVFTGFVPYNDLPRYLALGDVAVNTLEPGLVANAALPNKVLQYLASGLHVISTKLDGLVSIFSHSSEVSWASTPAGVIKLAIEKLKGGLNEQEVFKGVELESVLRNFLPQVATLALERSLVGLGQESRQE